MDDNLEWDIKWWLFQQQLDQQIHEQGKEFMSDIYLTDFAKAWRGAGQERNSTPKEVAAFNRAYKQDTTIITVGNGPTLIRLTDGGDRLQIEGGTGYVPVDIADIDDMISALQQAKGMLSEEGTPTSSTYVGDMPPKEIPIARWNGMTKAQRENYLRQFKAIK